MALSFTIDSPVKVGSYGIDSTISIFEDKLVEVMRLQYYKHRKEPYIPITSKQEGYRAKSITDYLNLVNKIIQEQIEEILTKAELQQSPHPQHTPTNLPIFQSSNPPKTISYAPATLTSYPSPSSLLP